MNSAHLLDHSNKTAQTTEQEVSPPQFCDAGHWPVSGNPSQVSVTRTDVYDPVKYKHSTLAFKKKNNLFI